MSETDYQTLIDNALLLQRDGENSLPPVEDWRPPLCGDMPLIIASVGRWWHEGRPIERESLVRLFASILKREGDEYFLVTPVEKWRISVEEVPFQVVKLAVLNQGGKDQTLVFTTALGDCVVADACHPLKVVVDAVSGDPAPYLLVRRNLEGKLTRSVFYQLADLAESSCDPGGERLGVISRGQFFPLE